MNRLLAALVALVVVLFARSAAAEPIRLLIAVGNKDGLAAERPLKFADNDAKRVKEVLTSLGGVRNEHAFFLAEPTRAALYGAIDKARAIAQTHRAEEVTLLFYFSGHGDRDAIHLSGDRLLIRDLSTKLGEVPAALRIAVTDACRATREKGFSADEPFAISTTLLPQASGQVWLHASSDGEAAQESDELQGAIFTHAWLSGLRGAADANGDARVTLDESFAFAHSQTLIRSSKSSGVMQKPEAVINLHEAAPVVITQTGARMASLALPQARDTHFLVYSAASKSVLSEVWGSPERRLFLRLPPGRYVVQRRVGGAGGIATIAIAAGEERRLEEGDFSSTSLDLLAKKGEDPDVVLVAPSATRSELSLGWDAGGDARTGFLHGPRIGYALAWTHVAITAGAGMTFAERDVAAGSTSNREDLTSGFGRLGVELRLPVGSLLLLRGGAGGRAGVISQAITDQPSKTAFAFGPEVVLGARLHVSRAVFADLSANGNLVFASEEHALRGVLGGTGALAIGARF